ncbi:MAG: extracellular solute-binding protein [Chloroflexaceae bacterium]|jgi:multiple sugar transport system substrate-binding protein|nr:extracellular solute-binding protein [Chloroflexaceae bacterium]
MQFASLLPTICFLLILPLLAMCGPAVPAPPPAPPAQGTPSTTTVIGFGAREQDRERFAPTIAAFNQQNPGVQVQFVPLNSVATVDSAVQRLEAMLRSADTLSLDLATLAVLRPDDVLDLGPLLAADASFNQAELAADSLRAAQVDGRTLFLPQTLQVNLLRYNQDMWSGTAPSEGQPWAALLEQAAALARQQPGTNPTYGFVDGSGGAEVLRAALATGGADLTFTGPLPAEDVLAQAIQGVVAGKGSQALAPASVADAARLVQEGRAAVWAFSSATGPAAPLPFATADMAFPADYPAAAPQIATGYAISGGTAHPEAAWRWLRFLHQASVPGRTGTALGVELPARQRQLQANLARLSPASRQAIEATLARPATPPRATLPPSVTQAIGASLSSVADGSQTATEAAVAIRQALEQARADLEAARTSRTGPLAVQLPVVPNVQAGATLITFRALDNDLGPFQALAEGFQRDNPNIVVEVKDSSGLGQQISPEVVAQNSDCFTYTSRGLVIPRRGPRPVLDLQPLIDSDPNFKLDDYPAVVLNRVRADGVLYGLPYAISLRALAYNQLLFDQANLPYPTADWSLDDLLAVAQQLTKGEGATKQYGFISATAQTDELPFFLSRFGALPLVQGTREQMSAEPARKAVQYYTQLLRETSPTTRIQGYDGSLPFDYEYLDLIPQGRAAMWLDSGSSMAQAARGELDSSKVRLGLVPPPLNNTPLSSADITRSWSFYISASTEHREACWRWITFLSSQESIVQYGFPARVSLAESEAFQQRSAPGSSAVYAAYKAAFERMSTTPAAQLMSPEIDDFWFFRAVDRVLQGGDVGRELNEAGRFTEEYMACLQGNGDIISCTRLVDPTYSGWR